MDRIFRAYVGLGLGGILENADSAVIDTLLWLEWLDILFRDLCLLLFDLFQGAESRFDTFSSASHAISLSIFAMLLFSSLMLALPGTVLGALEIS